MLEQEPSDAILGVHLRCQLLTYGNPRGTHRIVQQQHRNDQLPCHSSRPSRYTSSCASLSSGLLQLHRAHTRTRADVEFFLGPNLSNLSASSLLSNERRVFLLIGIGGCGKTQLARKFMKRVYQRFSERKQTHLVFYVDASTPTTLEAWFIAIAKPTGWTSQVRPRCPG